MGGKGAGGQVGGTAEAGFQGIKAYVPKVVSEMKCYEEKSVGRIGGSGTSMPM